MTLEQLRSKKAISGAVSENQKEAIRKSFEARKEAIDKKREYEDAVTKRQREKTG